MCTSLREISSFFFSPGGKLSIISQKMKAQGNMFVVRKSKKKKMSFAL